VTGAAACVCRTDVAKVKFFPHWRLTASRTPPLSTRSITPTPPRRKCRNGVRLSQLRTLTPHPWPDHSSRRVATRPQGLQDGDAPTHQRQTAQLEETPLTTPRSRSRIRLHSQRTTTSEPQDASKTASTELSERAKDKAAGKNKTGTAVARGGQRPRARAEAASRPNHQLQVQDVCLPLPRSSRDRTQQSSTQRGLGRCRPLIAADNAAGLPPIPGSSMHQPPR